MILINLLPQEYRQRKRTPLKFMAAMAASVAINGVLVAYWSWTAFGTAAEVQSQLALLQDTQSGLAPQVEYHKALEAESQGFQARERTLERITQSRVSWTQEVDQLIDIINDGGDGEKYLVWLDDLAVDMKENKRRGTSGLMKANGHSGSGDFSYVANFLDDIEASGLMKDFERPAPPEGSSSEEDKELQPSVVFSFPLEMALKAPSDRLEAHKKVEGGESK